MSIGIRAGLQFLVPDFAESTAFLTLPVRRVEREQTRIEFFECAAAVRTAHLRAHDGEAVFRIEQVCGAATDLERALREVARVSDSLRVDDAGDHRNRVLFESFESSKLRNRDELTIDKHRVKEHTISQFRRLERF